MAAGQATRLRPFSDRMPKPLAPVMGVPCSAFALRALRDAGVDEVVANIHHLPAETRQGLSALHSGMQFSDETSRLLGSAGGIRKALPALQAMGGSSGFFLLNSDNLCSLELHALARTHAGLRQRYGVQMTLALIERPHSGGEPYREILVDSGCERITGLGEKNQLGLMYVGCAIIEPEAVSALPENQCLDFVETILRPAISRGLAGVHRFSGSWIDIGSPELWWKCHLELMEKLDLGTLPESWSALIREKNSEISRGIWVGKGSSLLRAPSEWRGPSYWNGEGQTPLQLGPRSICYGSFSGGEGSAAGIGAHGTWVSFADAK